MLENQTKNCRECSAAFSVDSDDLSFYERMKSPVPALCPDCRFKWRAQFRNEMMLYTRACHKCEKRMVTVYSPDSPYVVYCGQCWDSDVWDPKEYAINYDTSCSFFEQFEKLMHAVPKRALLSTSGAGENVNSDYVNVASANKNCYLIFNTSYCEDSLYSRGLRDCKEVIDMYFGVNNELCYEGVNVNKSNHVAFGHNVNGSLDSIFILNASGCQNCFGSVNVRNETNLWFNEKLSKEEYEKRLSEVQGSHVQMEIMRKKFEEHILKYPQRENSNIKTVDSTGDYLFECKNVRDSLEITKGENCRYIFSSKQIKDSYDTLGYGYDSELLLDCCATGLSSNAVGTYWAELSKNIGYSFFVRNCTDCFGCDGIKNKKYSILNKEYPKEEYERLVGVIKEQMVASGEYGVFMPPSIAPFAYNETIAQDNMPMTKELALKAGYRWQDNLQLTTGKATMTAEQIPDNIKDVLDSITQEVLACVICQRNYKITQHELLLYRKMILPVPRKCFYCRHADRLRRRGPMKMFDRSCDSCKKAIRSTHDPKNSQIVYCEACYQEKVI